ncbi:hypothetical protein [Parendozoicomonas haliclonae]|uniref:Flagellin B n=1 Tax=Parendozoicomonas haliclonae TaxID=1960125 RepID=A0A1X7AN15_9GAMM|nr:hypothetical protein [Parendozoicomonas haliclonae]SMA49665.1 Flagellin B [Parendozoicomonas haliclonae]
MVTIHQKIAGHSLSQIRNKNLQSTATVTAKSSSAPAEPVAPTLSSVNVAPNPNVTLQNLNNAVSVLQLADQTFKQITGILGSMMKLAKEALKKHSPEEREALQEDLKKLLGEIDQLARDTCFGQQKLLDGSARQMNVRIGDRAQDSISFSLISLLPSSLGKSLHKADSGLLFRRSHHLIQDATLAFFMPEGNGLETTFYLLIASGKSSETAVAMIREELKNSRIKATPVYDTDTRSLELIGTPESLSQIGITLDNAWQDAERKIPAQTEREILSPDNASKPVSLNQISLTTFSGAQKAAIIIKTALEEVQQEQKKLGALQTKIDSALTQAGTKVETPDIPDSNQAQSTTRETADGMQQKVSETVIAQSKNISAFSTALK